MAKAWFAPKKTGYGSGLPIRWEGWAVLIGFLRLRAFPAMGLQSQWMDGLHGIGLAAVAYFVFYIAYVVLSSTHALPYPPAGRAVGAHLALTPWVVAAVVTVNSFYEEYFVSGYIITALKQKTTANIALNVSVAVRLLYHLYQGMMGVILIIPIGLVFGIWYGRTGRLWPLVVAHAALNLISFLPYVKV